MDFNRIFEYLEDVLGCRLVLHDVRYVFFMTKVVDCERRHWNIRCRNVEFCGLEDRDRCVAHCVGKLRKIMLAEHPVIRYWRCPAGYFQLTVPIFRNDILCGVLYAGLWRRPLDHEKIRRLTAILPVVAEGLFAQLEAARLQTAIPPRSGIRGKVLNLLETHYAEPLTLQWLARQLSLSPSRVCHVVSENFHQPFTKVLLNIRLEKACIYLRWNGIRVSEAARMCGFISLAYFSNEFRKRFGVSPREWQRERRRGQESNTFMI